MRATESQIEHKIDCINGNANRNFKYYKNNLGYTLMEGHKVVGEAMTSGECKAALDAIYYMLKK